MQLVVHSYILCNVLLDLQSWTVVKSQEITQPVSLIPQWFIFLMESSYSLQASFPFILRLLDCVFHL